MHNYPTTEEVQAEMEKHPPSLTDKAIVKAWKKGFYRHQWSKVGTVQKQFALKILMTLLWSEKHPHKKLNIEWDNLGWRYTPATNTITGTNPSIISALHEVGHALYGSSELKACTYSTSLFRACFPKEFSRLEWAGHMLRKPFTN